MAIIYISYSYADKPKALKLAEDLLAQGHEVNIDNALLTPGQQFHSILMDALKASDIFVILLSEKALESNSVMSELGAAQAFAQSSKKKLVVPVLLDRLDASRLPYSIRDLLYIQATNSDMRAVAAQVQEAIAAFIGRRAAEEQKEDEVNRGVQKNAAEYVNEAITELSKAENRNRLCGNIWYTAGGVALVLGVVFAGVSVVQTSSVPDFQWIRFAYLGLKSLVVVGLLLACCKYAFTLGKSYTNEALKNADRIHAIRFGKFYLQAFGGNVEWAELKEVFQHWNINQASSFAALDTSQFDPKFLEALVEVAKVASTKGESKS